MNWPRIRLLGFAGQCLDTTMIYCRYCPTRRYDPRIRALGFAVDRLSMCVNGRGSGHSDPRAVYWVPRIRAVGFAPLTWGIRLPRIRAVGFAALTRGI